MTDLYVSDHAVLRYLERVRGIDTGAIRLAIGDKAGAAVAMGAISVTVDGVSFAIQGNTITSVLQQKPTNYSRQKHHSFGRGNGGSKNGRS